MMNERAYDRIVTSAWIGLLLICAIAAVLLSMVSKIKADEIGKTHDLSASHRNYVPNSARNFRHARSYSTAQVVGSRPAGCPHRFCGCAMSLRYFGKIIPHLKLAANWKEFPPAAPAPQMVAARRGHVFQLLHHVEGMVWKVWDPNSGGGRIRIHQRSIAGYTIHNPRGGKIQMASAR